MSASLLDLQLPHKRFGDREVLHDVSLQLGESEVVSLVGASGCGKSTLLRIVAGLDRDHDGQVRLDGQPVEGPTPAIRFVFQEPRLFPWLTVADNIAFDAGGARGEAAEQVQALLREVGLEGLGTRWPKQLSGGQAQRTALARGLFAQPRLLLLDEPFCAVDAFTRMKLQDLLLALVRQHGVAVLMVTHDLDEAVRLSDRVLVMEADPGRLAHTLSLPPGVPREPDDAPVRQSLAQLRQALQAVHAF